MNKKNNLALFALLVVGLFSLFSINISAQKTSSMKNEQPLKQCSGERFIIPQSVVIGNEAFANFIKVMSLPSGERQETFSGISNEEKAYVYRVKLALEFTKRPNLSKEQKGLILDTISAILADTYDKENPELVSKAKKQAQDFQEKAAAIFPPDDAFKIFASINGDKGADIALLSKYEEKLTLPINVRRRVIRETSPVERRDFWKAQMIYHLATARLTKTQFEFIVETIPLLTVRAFDFPTVDGQPKNEETKVLDSLESRINTLFSKEEAFAIFMGLGLQREVPANREEYIIAIDKPMACECRTWCGASQICDGYGCRVTESGCGVFGGSPCDQFCS